MVSDIAPNQIAVAGLWDTKNGPRADLVFSEGLVRVAIQPAIPRLGRGDHRMPCCIGMPGCVAVGRAVTAIRLSAFLARAQLHPLRADLHALAAFSTLRMPDRGNSGDMRAGCC